MKISNIIATFLLALFAFTAQSFAQNQSSKSKYQTVEMKVEGVCGMCKSRIETTVYDLKGVKTVKYDVQASKLEVVIRPSKTSPEKIAKALAKAGHRSELMKADPKAYAALPDCCKYDDGVKKH